MPVRFRGVSEYSSTYKWNPSFRSPKFEPSPIQSQPEAGLRSDQLNLLVEPSFTRKRSVPHRRPEAQQCLAWWQDDDYSDFAEDHSLNGAGDNAHFKTVVVRHNNGKESESKVKASAKGDHRQESPKYNTEKINTVQNLNRSTWEKDIQIAQIQQEQKKTESVKKKPAKNVEKSPTKMRKAPERSPNETKKIAEGTGSPIKIKKPVLKSKFVKTSSQKSKTPKKDSKPNKHIPLQYRSLQQRYLAAHQTEYQNMFQKPTKFIPSSPLISALDVVHSSSPAIPPHRSPKMFSKSEYSANFKNRSPLSKSVPLSSPASPSMKLKVKDLAPHFQRTHSPSKLKSEYAKQFPKKDFPVDFQSRIQEEAHHNKLNREGSAFDKGHMNQICSPKNRLWDTSSYASSTSFVVQAEKESDAKVEESSEVSEHKSVNGEVKEEGNEPDEIETIEADFEKDSLDSRSITSFDALNGAKPLARKLAWDEQESNNDDASTITGTEVSQNSSGYGGRLPTPQLKNVGGALRSHHDLTTPCCGGTLLTSPTNSTKVLKRSESPTKTRSPKRDIDFDVQDHIKQDKTQSTPNMKPKACGKVDAKRAGDASPLMKTKVIRKAPTPTLPRRMQQVVRAPIQGALRSQEFQHCGRNTRPTSAFEIDRMSKASAASVEDLLQRSLQRKDFWKEN